MMSGVWCERGGECEGTRPTPWYARFVRVSPPADPGAGRWENATEPYIDGTRTPVWKVIELVTDIYRNDLRQLRWALWQLSLDQIEAALAYYADHTLEIDDAIARHRLGQ
jgi:uncharacterized protein (DUF433 family)